MLEKLDRVIGILAKGGPGSGRYPAGSGKNPKKEPRASFSEHQQSLKDRLYEESKKATALYHAVSGLAKPSESGVASAGSRKMLYDRLKEAVYASKNKQDMVDRLHMIAEGQKGLGGSDENQKIAQQYLDEAQQKFGIKDTMSQIEEDKAKYLQEAKKPISEEEYKAGLQGKNAPFSQKSSNIYTSDNGLKVKFSKPDHPNDKVMGGEVMEIIHANSGRGAGTFTGIKDREKALKAVQEFGSKMDFNLPASKLAPVINTHYERGGESPVASLKASLYGKKKR